jgi:hypothetical protein
MGLWIGITLKEVGGASTCGGLEAEGQEFFASCLSEAILKRSTPEPKGPLSQFLIPNIPTFHRSIGFNSQSELLFRTPRCLNFARLQPPSPRRQETPHQIPVDRGCSIGQRYFGLMVFFVGAKMPSSGV